MTSANRSVCVCVCACVRVCACVCVCGACVSKECSFLSWNFYQSSLAISWNKFFETEVCCQYIHSCFRMFSCLGKFKRNEEYVSCPTIFQPKWDFLFCYFSLLLLRNNQKKNFTTYAKYNLVWSDLFLAEAEIHFGNNSLIYFFTRFKINSQRFLV